MSMYHQGNRELQSRFGSVALADRLVEKTRRAEFTGADKEFIESCSFFFLATADSNSQPDCSFKGGAPGFVQIVAPNLLVYPDYDGNNMFKSLGNIRTTLKPAFSSSRWARSRNACASTARRNCRSTILCSGIFLVANCWYASRRRIFFRIVPATSPRCRLPRPSAYLPQAGCAPMEPAWKGFPDFCDVVPKRKPTP